jgi:glutamate dehydrogenase
VDQLKTMVEDIISDHEKQGVASRAQAFIQAGAPADLAHEVARLRPLTSTSDVVDLAARNAWPLEPTARIYHAIGARFSFDRLRGLGGDVSSDLHWDRLAVRRLMEDFYGAQQTFTASAMNFARQAGGSLADGVETPSVLWAESLVEAWSAANEEEAGRVDNGLLELDLSGAWTLSKLAIASTHMREMASHTKP